MNETRSDVADAAAEILADLSTPELVRASEAPGWNAELWSVLASSGFAHIALPEELGGSGGDLAEAAAVVEQVGRYAASVPVAEHALLGGWLASGVRWPVDAGPLTCAVGHREDSVALRRRDDGWVLDALLHRVPWGAHAHRVVLLASADGRPVVVAVDPRAGTVRPGRNLAGESRDTVELSDVVLPADAVRDAPAHVHQAALRQRGALARAVASAGALGRVTELSVRYTSERQQFGRPVGRFQAVQRHVVRIAEQTQAARLAAHTAALNAADGEPDAFDVAAAAIVCARAASIAAQASHQAHGAIGMTKEYELGQHTRRLWSWRDEFGGEAFWGRTLGHELVGRRGAGLWDRVSQGLLEVPA